MLCCVDNKRYFGSENSRFNFTVSLVSHFHLDSSDDSDNNSKPWLRANYKIRVTVNQKVKSDHNKTYAYNCVTRDSKCLLSMLTSHRLLNMSMQFFYRHSTCRCWYQLAIFLYLVGRSLTQHRFYFQMGFYMYCLSLAMIVKKIPPIVWKGVQERKLFSFIQLEPSIIWIHPLVLDWKRGIKVSNNFCIFSV